MIYIKISFYSQSCYLSCLKKEGEGDYTADTISHCSRTTKTTIFCFKVGNLQFQSTNNKTFLIF